MNRSKLLFGALTKFLIGVIAVGAMLFAPAGSLAYFEAWLFMGLLFLPIFILGVVLFIKSPELLEKRLKSKETENAQKIVVALSGLMFIVGFIVAGLDHRFSWSHLPPWVTIVASVILLGAYGLYAEVIRENAYLSRTIEVTADQRVIDTKLYGIIRHPMYATTILLFLSIPLVLGSLPALFCFIPYVIMIVIRIVNEEKVLESQLRGYSEYQKKVKYRLIPFIW